jgi:hypothetical protein
MKIYFDHEKLDVYREAITFCAWVGDFLAAISAKAATKDQLDRASTSIPLNIAEGNGKFSAKGSIALSRTGTWVGARMCGLLGHVAGAKARN